MLSTRSQAGLAARESTAAALGVIGEVLSVLLLLTVAQ